MNINIEIGKTYSVRPKVKKSVVEIESFEKRGDNGSIKIVSVETGWRGGEWAITINNENERDYLKDIMEDDDEYLDLSMFEESECYSTWDGCWEDYSFVNVEEEEENELREGMEEEGFFSYLDDKGWEPFDFETFIHNGIHVEEVNGD